MTAKPSTGALRTLARESGADGAEGRSALEVDNIAKVFQDSRGHEVRAVDGVSFSLEPGEFYTLLGPSGCGKTTTLRSVAGLEAISSGRIAVDGVTFSEPARKVEVPPHRRGLGMVFQSYAIWPHMTVAQNVAFPLEVAERPPSRKEIGRRVQEALEAVELGGLGPRMATQLSGGQQQRLALARALVGRPGLLLLDEPLSNLDAKLREAMRAELRRIQRRIGVTTLYVTHDQMEALSMSNRIAVMSQGRIVQEGKPEEIYRRPSTRFVAEFLGNSNFLRGKLAETIGGDGVYSLEGFDGTLVAPRPADLPVGETVSVVLRFEEAELRAGDASVENGFLATVAQVMYLGESLQYHVVSDDGLEVIVRASPMGQRFERDERVQLVIPRAHAIVISDDHGVAAGELVASGMRQ